MGKAYQIMLYTDGACTPNPGRGGWAAILDYKGIQRELKGGYLLTTNNRMELLAVIHGLEALAFPCEVTIVTDSKYVINPIQQGWILNWASKPNFGGKKNKDLWMRLLKLLKIHKVSWQHIKGHSGHEFNERCDQLAVGEYSPEKILVEDIGYVPN